MNWRSRKSLLSGCAWILLTLGCRCWAATPPTVVHEEKVVTGLREGQYDVAWRVFDAAAGGSEVAGGTNMNQATKNGSVGVTVSLPVDAAGGAGLWLQVGFRTNGATEFDLSERTPARPPSKSLSLFYAKLDNGDTVTLKSDQPPSVQDFLDEWQRQDRAGTLRSQKAAEKADGQVPGSEAGKPGWAQRMADTAGEVSTVDEISLSYVFVAVFVCIFVSSALEKRLKHRLPATKPYEWGFWFGSMGAGCAPLALLYALAAFWWAASQKWEACGRCAALAAWLALMSASGWYIVKRRRWAWVVGTIFGPFNIILWIAHYYYGRHRWEEFGAEALAGASRASQVPATSATTPPLTPRVAPLPELSLYIWLNGEARGPFSIEQLEALSSVNAITADTPCCHDGAERWLTVGAYHTPSAPCTGESVEASSEVVHDAADLKATDPNCHESTEVPDDRPAEAEKATHTASDGSEQTQGVLAWIKREL